MMSLLHYQSAPYPQTRPVYWRELCSLFSVTLPSIDGDCRVLSLGCSDGQNLIAMACQMPETYFCGVDINAEQIEQGQKHIKNLDLTNIELVVQDISDIDKNFGEFDYIIAHGVISWVPEDVQDKIFSIMQENLKTNGACFISFNTMPGWNNLKTMRDMLLMTVGGVDDQKEKIVQCNKFIDALQQMLVADTTSSRLIAQEIEIIKNRPEFYLLHDYLSAYNRAFYISDFIEMAGKYGLNFVCDANLSSMFNVDAVLEGFCDNFVQKLQYLDLLNNRRFHNVILTKQSVNVDYALADSVVRNSYLSCDLFTEDGIIYKNNYISLTADNPALAGMLDKFAKYPGSVIQAKDLLGPNALENGFLLRMIKDFIKNGCFEVAAGAQSWSSTLPQYPRMSDLALYQVGYQNWITSNKHEKITLSDKQVSLAKLLDGKHNVDILGQKLTGIFDRNELLSTLEGFCYHGILC